MRNVIKTLEYMTIGTSLHDKDGNILYVNPIFCKIFNTENKLLLNKKLSKDYINVEIESKFDVFEFLNNNFNNINDFIVKLNYNNSYKLIKINSIKIKNGIDYYILTYDDITDNINYSFLYDEIFNNIKSGIILCYNKNDDFYIKDINPYCEKIYNINRNKIKNKKISSIKLPIINDTELVDILYNTWKTNNKFEEKNVNCDDKNICWRDIYIQKTITGDIIIMFNDVTELIESKRKIEEYNKQKTTFLSNMSHEIRSPINSIIGFADIINFDSNNIKKQKEYINIIKNSSKMLFQLVDDILDTTKIEAGKVSINKDYFSVNRVMNELYLTAKSNNKNNKIKIIKNCPTEKINLLNDEFRFNQILTNLITNSIKFTNKGYIKIGYELKENDIIFFVKDTGIGIKEEDKNKIFDRFHKIHNNSKIGSGLGLSISKELSKLMGGELYFDSTYGEGSTFYFKLPLDKKIKKLYNNNYNINENLNNLDLSNKTILIVEDIEFNMKLLTSYLEDTNAKLILAYDGNDALIKYNENKNNLDLILMDIQIPNMEGTEVTQIIRTIDQDIIIIAQTAYALKEEINDILDYGFNDLIKKPLKKNELLNIIKKYTN